MKIKAFFEKAKQTLKSAFVRADDFTGGVLSILRQTFTRFAEARGSEAAASLAYYAFFSIFPMVLVFIVVGSFFVDRSVVQARVLAQLEGVIPGAEDVVVSNIERVLNLRGAVTFVAALSLVWSATSVFNILALNINRAFPKASVPNFLKGRLLGFFMFLAIGGLLLLSLAASTFSGLIPVINIPFNDKALHETVLWQIVSFMIPVFLNMLLFWALYYWVPQVTVSRKASLMGGLITGVLWELLNNAFTWYLSSGLSRYRLIYGSVGTVVALMFWIYLTATIMLLGAHLTSSIQASMAKKPHVIEE
jgi:YihY family inner membrane protein